MNKISYLPLTFVSTAVDIKRHITNTIIMKHVIETENTLVKLEELLKDTQYGYTASAQQEGSHKLLRITDIQNGDVNWEDVPFCDCEQPDKYIVKKGDILVARTGGTTGKSFLVTDDNTPENVVYASYLIKLRTDKEKLLPEYLNLFMNSYVYWSQITEMKSGSAQPNVNANKLKKLKIPYCSVHEQKELINLSKLNVELNSKIINACNQYDKVIEAENLLQEQEKDIELYRTLILRNAIQGKLVQQNENDESASVLLDKIRKEKERLIKEKKIKNDKLLPQITDEEKPFDLPNGWEWARFGEVTNNIESGKSPKCENRPAIYPEWGVLKVSAVSWGTFNPMENKFLPMEDLQNEKFEVHQGDFLMSRANTAELVARSVIIKTKPPRRLLLSDKILRLKFTNNIDSQYMNIVNASPYSREYYANIATGTSDSMKNVSREQIKNLPIPLPPVNEQKRIVEKVKYLMKICEELEINIEQSKHESKNLMKAVLQEAFIIKEVILN